MPKTVLITGAGSGIGKDTAFALARRGHRVIATTETQAQGDALLAEAKSAQIALESFKLDVTVPVDREQVLKHGPIDVLINNAGVGVAGSLAELDLEVVRRSFEVNVFGSLALAQLVLPGMFERRSGTVLFIGSTAGRVTIPFLGAYCMTKFSLAGGVEALRGEVHSMAQNVHVSLIEPGAYHTGFNQRMIGTHLAHHPHVAERLQAMFAAIEVRSTTSIVKTIVRAVEASAPRIRYTAPWWQAVGIQVARMTGR